MIQHDKIGLSGAFRKAYCAEMDNRKEGLNGTIGRALNVKKVSPQS